MGTALTLPPLFYGHCANPDPRPKAVRTMLSAGSLFFPSGSYASPEGKTPRPGDVRHPCRLATRTIIIFSVKEVRPTEHPHDAISARSGGFERPSMNPSARSMALKRFYSSPTSTRTSGRKTDQNGLPVPAEGLFRRIYRVGRSPLAANGHFPLPFGDFGKGFVPRSWDERSFSILTFEPRHDHRLSSTISARKRRCSRRSPMSAFCA